MIFTTLAQSSSLEEICRGAPCFSFLLLKAKEQNNAPLIVCDPRFTRTAAHADECTVPPGSDVGLIWGIMWHIFENGWEDKEFIRQRVYGMDDVLEEVKVNQKKLNG